MTEFKPFADDSASTGIAGLTIENGTHKLSLYGSLDITRDRQGLAHAQALAGLLSQAIAVLDADPALHETPAKPAPPHTVRNPFA